MGRVRITVTLFFTRRRLPGAIEQARSAFTLIELLATIAIVGLMAGLLMPAVQMAREASRGFQCRNNLKQIGLAILSYDNAMGRFPPSKSPWSQGPRPKGPFTGRAWTLEILPQLDQQALFDSFAPSTSGDFFSGGGLGTASLKPLLKTILPHFQCPSDMSAVLSTQQYGFSGTLVATTDYKGSIGNCRVGSGSSVHQGTADCHDRNACKPPGLFYRDSYQDMISSATINDGMSRTFAVGEDVPDYNTYSAAFFANDTWNSCDGAPNYYPVPLDLNLWWNLVTFRSRHPGGVNFVLADGSTIFIDDTIDISVYWALSTKAGREAL